MTEMTAYAWLLTYRLVLYSNQGAALLPAFIEQHWFSCWSASEESATCLAKEMQMLLRGQQVQRPV